MLFRPPQFLVRIARDSFLTALPTLRILPEFPRLFHSSKLFLPSDRRRKFGGARKPEAGSLSISHVLNVPKNILLLFNTTLQHNMPKRRDEHRSAVNRDNYKSDSSGDEGDPSASWIMNKASDSKLARRKIVKVTRKNAHPAQPRAMFAPTPVADPGFAISDASPFLSTTLLGSGVNSSKFAAPGAAQAQAGNPFAATTLLPTSPIAPFTTAPSTISLSASLNLPTTKTSSIHPRDSIFNLLASLGRLSAHFYLFPNPPNKDADYTANLTQALVAVFNALHNVAVQTEKDLGSEVMAKFALNAKKYPSDLCKGKAGKYTDYAVSTGVTADISTQITAVAFASPTITSIAEHTRAFVKARQWEQFHTPRNVLLALTGEVGELCEIFQWKGDGEYETDPTAKKVKFDGAYGTEETMQIGQELADCAIYLVRLADLCGVDLEAAIKAQSK